MPSKGFKSKNLQDYKFTISKAYKHFKLVCKHRFFVFKYCWKAGLYWQGLVHDLSKFSPVEFINSVKYFTGERSPIENAKDAVGFSAAWLHHKGRNKHHYEYWVDYIDDDEMPCKMPFCYAIEMVCDYIAAGKSYKGKSWKQNMPLEFWKKKKVNAKIHPETANFLSRAFEKIADEGTDALATINNYKSTY